MTVLQIAFLSSQLKGSGFACASGGFCGFYRSLSLSIDICPTGDIFFSMKTMKETRCRLKQNCWKQGLSRLKLSSVKPVWQELLLLFFVLWPVNSGSGWGFQHPSCQGCSAVPGCAGRSLSVWHGVSQLHLSTTGGFVPKCHQAETAEDCSAEEVGNTVTEWTWEQKGDKVSVLSVEVD